MKDTRNKLLSVATRQFADRGFYGASIADITSELGVTKQTLLHHFGTKAGLYGEILKGISARATQSLEEIKSRFSEPELQLEEVVANHFTYQVDRPDEARLLMRELLDNESRAEKAGNWYLKPYMEALIEMLRRVNLAKNHTPSEALAIVYQLLGAANYLVVSQPTLLSMFGAEVFEETREVYEQELRTMVRCRIELIKQGHQ